jgi:hypothetical protein
MKFWYGSGSADPYLLLMDPDADADPDPAIFVSDIQDVYFFTFYIIFFQR